jgi:hypothetical protein
MVCLFQVISDGVEKVNEIVHLIGVPSLAIPEHPGDIWWYNR